MIPHQTHQLAELASSVGEPSASAGNHPVLLDDPGVVWFVECGALDVFLIDNPEGEQRSSPKHVLRAEAGRLVFGMRGRDGGSLAAIAKGLPGSQLRRIQLKQILDHCGDELADQVDVWVSEFTAAVTREIESHPRPGLLLDPGKPVQSLEAEAGCVLSARTGGVFWAIADGAVAYLGTEEPKKKNSMVLLTSDSWLTLQEPTHVTGVSSWVLNRNGRLASALSEFHRLALGAHELNQRLLLADEVNQQTARAVQRAMDKKSARQGLFNVLRSDRPAMKDAGSSLLAALELIGKHEGIVFRSPPVRYREPSLHDILNASGIRARKVRLFLEDRWWLGDSGAMLGFHGDDGRPMALLPGLSGQYRMADPVSGESARVNANRAQGLSRSGWQFYRTLPTGQPVGTKDVVRLVGKGTTADFCRFATAGLLANALTLVPAIAVGILANWVLPAGSGGMLAQVTVALVAFSLLGTLLHILGGTALMRLEGRATIRATSAFWDRLLRMPSSFFRGFTAGELAVRAGVFHVLRDRTSGVAANAMLSIIFLLPTLSLLFLYDVAMAWLSMGIGLLSLVVTALFGFLQLAPQRRRFAAVRRLTGEILQFINGMSKLHSAGAEPSAFASWAKGYREQQMAAIRISRLNEHMVAFSTAVPVLASAALFAVALWQGSGQLDVGNFLVVYAASMTFYVAVVGLGESFEAIAAIVPGYEQVKPILAALPEDRNEGEDPGELNGEIHFNRVSFRYDDGPLIIDNVSIEARPGEFIAIVGGSGSGKSTLVRLALGLEDPSAGGIFFDGRDLAQLDRRLVRRQIGVVMQDGDLVQGVSILDNIIGVGDALTIEDAEKAARMAGVQDEIDAMPMGMFTAITESRATLSGGQVQRIRIAAALVRNPRILILDEATSWLDAKTQAEVMRGINGLIATRIVIAHRLSTIRHADRIYVMEAGRVVQQGCFDELFEVEGPFRNLVLRQMD